jgi:hypothetical protein
MIKDEQKAIDLFESAYFAEQQGRIEEAKRLYGEAAGYSVGGTNGIAERALARKSNLTSK